MGAKRRLQRLEQDAARQRDLRDLSPMQTLTACADGRLRDAAGNDCGPVDGLQDVGYGRGYAGRKAITKIVVPARPDDD
jgi:hypothetical protein